MKTKQVLWINAGGEVLYINKSKLGSIHEKTLYVLLSQDGFIGGIHESSFTLDEILRTKKSQICR